MNTNLPLFKRRIIVIDSDGDNSKLLKKFDWKNILTSKKDIEFFKSLYNHKKNLKNDNRTIFQKFKDKLIEEYNDGLDALYSKKETPFLVLKPEEVINKFTFPPSHPQEKYVYATSDINPTLYIPISRFHKYMYESKMASFSKLCSSLGAKSCRILYAEENGKDITSKVKIQNIPTPKGILDSQTNLEYSSKSHENVDVYMSFPQCSNIYKLEDEWLNSEPTWQSLQQIRLENDIEKYTAEFNYIDDLGVNLNIANSLNKIGFNIGGTYDEYKKIKYKFEVEFWIKK